MTTKDDQLDKDDLANEYLSVVNQFIQKNLVSDDLDLSVSADEYESALSLVFSDDRVHYRLDNAALLSYFLALNHPTTSHFYWVFGLSLAEQIGRHVEIRKKKRGRPSGWPKRVYVCAYIEWCREHRGLSDVQSISMAALNLQIPKKRLNSWYFGGKGKASDERLEARRWIEHTDQLLSALAGDLVTHCQDLEFLIKAYLPPRLTQEIQKILKGSK